LVLVPRFFLASDADSSLMPAAAFSGVTRGATVPDWALFVVALSGARRDDLLSPPTAPLAPPRRSGAWTGGCSAHSCVECLLNRCSPGIPVPLANPLLRLSAAHPSQRMAWGAVQNPLGLRWPR
jgi:hypothetical protein